MKTHKKDKLFKIKDIFNNIYSIIYFINFSKFFSIKTKGFEDRVHVVLKNLARENLWEKMFDDKGVCFDRQKIFCKFDNNFDQSIVLIGDSHAEVISYNLYEQTNKTFNLITMNRADVSIFLVSKKLELIMKVNIKIALYKSKLEIENVLKDVKDSYIILLSNYKEHFKKN